MNTSHLVVVGASLAGLRAVESARRAGFAGRISLIGAEHHLPYDRPPLSKAFLEVAPEGATSRPFRSEEYLRDDLNVHLLLGQQATSLDTNTKTVTIEDGFETSQVNYDSLIIATGASPRSFPGAESLSGVHSLRTLDDARAIRDALESEARVVVIGAGFIGSEIAAAARKRDLHPVVVEALPTPLVRAIGQEMGEWISALHAKHGTDLRCGFGVERLEGDGKVERVVMADGSVIEADLVVVGMGTIPSVSWLEGSGLTLDNGVVCDENLYTGIDGVYAAGDVARWSNPTYDRLMRIEHWHSAAEQGAAAAWNAVNPVEATTPYSTVPYFWSDLYDVRVQFVGISQADEILVVEGGVEDAMTVALYREGDRLTGALTVNGQTEIMKYRGMITRKASWADALEFANKRKERRRAKEASKAEVMAG